MRDSSSGNFPPPRIGSFDPNGGGVDGVRSDLAHTAFTFPGHVVVLLADDAEPSRKVIDIVKRRWFDIDRLTGEDLLILAPCRPEEETTRADHGMQDGHRWSKPDSRQRTPGLSDFLNDVEKEGIPLPALLVLRAKRDGDDLDLEGVPVSISTLTTEDSLVDAFQWLANNVAASTHRFDAEGFVRAAESATKYSLRWRRAVASVPQTLNLVADLLDLFRRLKSG